MKRVYTKAGDIFCAKLNDGGKRYFQYICNGLTQLNSDVIRVFEKIYAIDEQPSLNEIIEGTVNLCAHCVVKSGVKRGLWEKVGSVKDVGDFDNIVFRNTNDYGYKIGQTPVKISEKWYVWKINDKDFRKVKIEEIKKIKSYVGLVFNPFGIVELLNGNIYPVNYPRFE